MRKLVTNPVVGKVVTRWLAGNIPMDFKITGVTDDRIICGDWISTAQLALRSMNTKVGALRLSGQVVSFRKRNKIRLGIAQSGCRTLPR